VLFGQSVRLAECETAFALKPKESNLLRTLPAFFMIHLEIDLKSNTFIFEWSNLFASRGFGRRDLFHLRFNWFREFLFLHYFISYSKWSGVLSLWCLRIGDVSIV
jgi:hypothetical protein